MSLMQPTKNEEGLHIAAIFDVTPTIWTADQLRLTSTFTWVVYFGRGYCSYHGAYNYGYGSYIRAVRLGQNMP